LCGAQGISESQILNANPLLQKLQAASLIY
jgi:hypothetical protein